MKRLTLFTVLFGLFALIAGCGGDAAPAPTPDPEYSVLAQPGVEFSLPLGQTALIRGAELYITFIEVVNDSRCPQGAQCIWAGRVTVRIEFRDADSSGVVETDNTGLTGDPDVAVWEGHHFEFQVLPYPAVGQELDPASYCLRLSVSG